MTFLLLVAAIGAVLLLSILLWQKPGRSIPLLFVLLVLGELARITIPGLGLEVLALDMAVLGVGGLWCLKRIATRQKVHLGPVGQLAILFLLVAAISLLFNSFSYTLSENLQSLFYLIRLGGYALIYVIARNEPFKLSRYIQILTLAAAALSLIGFVQLFVVPDFTFMAVNGWDPHIGRLLSTWFDPNFLGGFLAFVLIVLLNLLFGATRKEKKPWLWVVISSLIILAALYLTYSRSAYLTLFVGLFLTGVLRSPRLLAGTVILGLIFGLAVPRAQERIESLYQSTFAFATDSLDYTLDETARLRIESWQQALEIFGDNPILGVGYNTLRFYKYHNGMASSPEIHSASGADSSFLTILSTTGLLGLCLFAILFWQTLSLFYRAAHERVFSQTQRNTGYGLLLGSLALLVHSLFVNSLLLPYFLLTLFVGAGVMEQSLSNRKVIATEEISI